MSLRPCPSPRACPLWMKCSYKFQMNGSKRQVVLLYLFFSGDELKIRFCHSGDVSMLQHTSAYVRHCQHASACVSMCQHASAYFAVHTRLMQTRVQRSATFHDVYSFWSVPRSFAFWNPACCTHTETGWDCALPLVCITTLLL